MKHTSNFKRTHERLKFQFKGRYNLLLLVFYPGKLAWKQRFRTSRSPYQSSYKSRSLENPSLKRKRAQRNGSSRNNRHNPDWYCERNGHPSTQLTLLREPRCSAQRIYHLWHCCCTLILLRSLFKDFSRSKHNWRNRRFSKHFASKVKSSCLYKHTTSGFWFRYQKNLHYRK